MRIRKLAIAALIAAVPTTAAFAESTLDQSVPRVSPRARGRRQQIPPLVLKVGIRGEYPIRGGYPNGHL